MNDQIDKYNDFIIRGILANNEFAIKEVHDLVSLKSMYFEKERYMEIKKLIERAEIDAIKSLSDTTTSGIEFLEIMKFKDQDGNSYVVTAYDNNNLEQDPQIIEIFPL
jgi:hypothetical protein